MTAIVTPPASSASLPTPEYVASPTSDLVPPPAGGVANAGDLALIYSLLSRERGVGLSLGQSGVAATKEEQASALAKQLAAIQQEAQNQSNSGNGFLGSVGQIVSDVVNDVVNGNFSGAVGDAGRDLGAAWNSPHFWSDLQNGLEEISVVSAAVSQSAQQFGGPVGTAVAAVAFEIDQGADLGANLAGAREAMFAAAAKNAEADALSAKNDIGTIAAQSSATIDAARSDDASLGRALTAVAGALSTNDHSLVASAALKG